MNKKRILISLGMIVAVGAIVIGATAAYFSDTATSTSNSFVAGTLDLKLANPGDSYSQSVTGTFSASNMVPGGSETTGKVWLKNTGTTPADHVRITSVVNTPSDNGMTEPECKAYNGEWKWWSGTNPRTLCVLSASVDQAKCDTYDGKWYNFNAAWPGYGSRCYAEINTGFKDNLGGWNDVDKYLQVTSIKYAGISIPLWTGSGYDFNGNGYVDLDDLERGPWTKDGGPLDNLKPAPGTSGSSPHSFEMKVKLHSSADNHYQTDKNGIMMTFVLNQDSSQ